MITKAPDLARTVKTTGTPSGLARSRRTKNFPLRYADDHYVPENWKQTIAFLRDNLAEDEHFFILTDEISLYYFVGKECPVRFPLLSLVDNIEKYQKEIIDDLQRKKVKYVIAVPEASITILTECRTI